MTSALPPEYDEPPPEEPDDELLRAIRLMAKYFANAAIQQFEGDQWDGEPFPADLFRLVSKKYAADLYRMIEVLKGDPLAPNEKGTALGRQLSKERRVGVIRHNSNRRAAMVEKPPKKLSAQDEAWRQRAIAEGTYDPDAKPVEEAPWCGLVRP